MIDRPDISGAHRDYQIVKGAAFCFLCSLVALGIALLGGHGWITFLIIIACCGILAFIFYWVQAVRQKIADSIGRLRKQLTAAPELEGTLLDGLWLPLGLRLTCWSTLPVSVVLVIFYPLLWAPLTRAEKRAAAFNDFANSRDQQVNEAPQSPENAVNRGSDVIDSAGARHAVGGAPAQGALPFLPGLPSGPPPKPLPTQPSTGPSPQPPIYFDVPQDWPGGSKPPQPQPQTQTPPTTTQRITHVSNGSSWVPIPLAIIARLLGWGSPDTQERTVVLVNKVVQDQPLSQTELDNLLKLVPDNGVDDYGQGVRQLIQNYGVSEPVKKTSLANLDAALKQRELAIADADAESKQRAGRIVEWANGTPPKSPDDVVKLLRNELPNGKFPSDSAKRDVLLLIEKPLGSRFSSFRDKINSDL